MKILHVIADLDERVGGPPRNVATLAEALDREYEACLEAGT